MKINWKNIANMWFINFIILFVAGFFSFAIFVIAGEYLSRKFSGSSFSRWWNSNVITEYSVDPEFTEDEIEALRISNFINFVKKECEKNGVEFQSSEGRFVELSEDIK